MRQEKSPVRLERPPNDHSVESSLLGMDNEDTTNRIFDMADTNRDGHVDR